MNTLDIAPTIYSISVKKTDVEGERIWNIVYRSFYQGVPVYAVVAQSKTSEDSWSDVAPDAATAMEDFYNALGYELPA